MDSERGDPVKKETVEEPKYNKKKAKHKLYDYQQEAVELLEQAIFEDETELPLVQIPTGGGKTRTVNEFLYRHYISEGKNVLWVATKSWELLKQASSDLIERYRYAEKKLGRIGGTGEVAFLEESFDRQVLYSTIHTFYARADEIVESFEPDIIVIDELDLGEGKKMWSSLVDQYTGVCPIIGVTATPVEGTRFQSVYSISFPELVEDGFLAKMEAYRVRTGRDWDPQFNNKLLTKSSLEELTDYRRNRIVCKTYDPEKHGKTLVFAVDKNHARELAKTFNDRFADEGLDCRADYIVCDVEEKAQIFEEFKSGEIDVLINVEMITRGVDVPDIETIFMARPTESDRLYIQMVGRGARKVPGGNKESFNIIEFTDNILNHGDYFVSYESYFGKAPQEINYMFALDAVVIEDGKSYFDALVHGLDRFLYTSELVRLCESLNQRDRLEDAINTQQSRKQLLADIREFHLISEVLFSLVACQLLDCENLDGHFYLDRVVRDYSEFRQEMDRDYSVDDLVRILKFLNIQFPPMAIPIDPNVRKNDMIDLVMMAPQNQVREALETLFAWRGGKKSESMSESFSHAR